MLRWTVLVATFAAWIGCMALVYINYGPREAAVQMPGAQATLDAIFSENAEPVRAWEIYVDPVSLAQTAALLPGASGATTPASRPAWDGVDESGLVEAGWVEVTLDRKTDARVAQTTELSLTFPRELHMPLLEVLDRLSYTSSCDISADEGIETFSSSLRTGFMDVATLGNRSGNELSVTMDVQHNGTPLLHRRLNFPVLGKASPGVDLAPFQPRPDIHPGLSWDIVMLDTTAGLGPLLSAADPKLVFLKAKCTGRQQIHYAGHTLWALAVTTPSSAERAWYSADGRVLKEQYRIADMFEVILVRADPQRRGHGLRLNRALDLERGRGPAPQKAPGEP